MIFIDLTDDGFETAIHIREYVLQWNEQQSVKGLSVVQLPLIVGIGNLKDNVRDEAEVLLHQIDRPINQEKVNKVVFICAKIV